MALPPIIKARSEHVRLVSPCDTAIDARATDTAALMAYVKRDDLDVGRLSLVPGVEPTWFTVRALTENEKRILQALLPTPPHELAEPCWHADCEQLHQAELELADDPSTVQPLTYCRRARRAFTMQMAALYIRAGLVSVEGWEGWGSADRTSFMGMRLWSEALVDAIDETTLVFLGMAINDLSTLTEKKRSFSGSSLGDHGGISAKPTMKAVEDEGPDPSTGAETRSPTALEAVG